MDQVTIQKNKTCIQMKSDSNILSKFPINCLPCICNQWSHEYSSQFPIQLIWIKMCKVNLFGLISWLCWQKTAWSFMQKSTYSNEFGDSQSLYHQWGRKGRHNNEKKRRRSLNGLQHLLEIIMEWVL